MTPDPVPVPPAFISSNGSAPAVRTAEAAERTADTAERAASLLADLPRAIGGMLAQVVRAIPSQQLCAACLTARIAWEAAHGHELEAAIAAAAAAHGLPEGVQLPPGFDPSPFLAEDLRPGGRQGMPPLSGAVTTVGGTATCPEHIPGRTGRRPLLIANGPLTASALAQLAG